jgi:ketosteroid isomerase-like protein
VRDEVKAAVEGGIQKLLAERERDPHRRLRPRRWRQEQEASQLATADPDAWLVTRAFEAWNEQGVDGAAAWLSRWVELVDPPDRPDAATWRGRERALVRLSEVTSELGATSVHVTHAHTIGDEVVADFELRQSSGVRTDPPGFSALFEVDGGQIARMRVFGDREAAVRASEFEADRQAT